MRDYKKLEVWKKANEFYIHVKKNIILPLNIVEGSGRYTDKDFTHFLDNSLGSTNEADYCCYAAFELNYTTEQEYKVVNKLVNEVRAMLIAFKKFLRNEK